MAISVIDAATKNPLADVTMKLNGYGEKPASKTPIKTDRQGKATVPIPAGELRQFMIIARKDGFVPMRLLWPTQNDQGATHLDIPATYTLAMPAGTKISGKVVDDTGQPVSGATVVLDVRNKGDRESHEAAAVWWKNVKTDEQGKWSFDGAPSQIDEIDVGVHHPLYDSGQADGYFPMAEFQPIAALRDGSAMLTLPRGVRVEGTVTDPDGKPIAGAIIGLGTDRVATNTLPTVKTDANGHYATATSPGSTTAITVKAKGFAPDLKQTPIGQEKTVIDFKLQAPRTLRGRVVDASGNPVKGARIFTDTWRGCRTLDTHINARADGTFEWKDAPADAILCDILALGHADVREMSLQASDKDVTITMRKALLVRGTVIDAQTNEPIPNFRILDGIVREGQPTIWEHDRRSGSNGKFEYALDYPYPGYAARIEAEGYLPADSRTFKLEEGAVNLTFKLRKGSGLGGIAR